MAKLHPLALAFRRLGRVRREIERGRKNDHALASEAIRYAITWFETWGDPKLVKAFLQKWRKVSFEKRLKSKPAREWAGAATESKRRK